VKPNAPFTRTEIKDRHLMGQIPELQSLQPPDAKSVQRGTGLMYVIAGIIGTEQEEGILWNKQLREEEEEGAPQPITNCNDLNSSKNGGADSQVYDFFIRLKSGESSEIELSPNWGHLKTREMDMKDESYPIWVQLKTKFQNNLYAGREHNENQIKILQSV